MKSCIHLIQKQEVVGYINNFIEFKIKLGNYKNCDAKLIKIRVYPLRYTLILIF